MLELAVTSADKGGALLRLRAELGAAAALHLGDDRTDEDAFRALPPDDVTVKVGRAGPRHTTGSPTRPPSSRSSTP